MSKSRKEIEHRQRRKYILECAEKLFADKGFDGVTVADIAKASEFSVGSLYLFFDNKEALIQSLLLERVQQVTDILESELERDISPLKKLENVIEGILVMFTEHFDYFRVFEKEVRGSQWGCSKEILGGEFHKILIRGYECLAAIFQQGIDEGVFKKDIEPLYMAFFLDACLHSLVMYTVIHGKNLPIEKVREGMQDMFYNGILKEPKNKKKS